MRRVLVLSVVCIGGLTASVAVAEPYPRGAQDSLSTLLDQASPATDAANWRSTQVSVSPKSSLRIKVADPLTAATNGRPLTPGGAEPQDYEVSLVRAWPKAVSFKTGKVGVDVSPHAAVGVTARGGMAEAGATVKLSQRQRLDDAAREQLQAMGVEDGARYGDQGRWYLFAAASGRAVGLNSGPNLDRGGWTTDESSTLVGDAQVGVGWRKGPMQTSLGVMHREVKAQHAYYGYQSKPDTVVGLSFAIRPTQ